MGKYTAPKICFSPFFVENNVRKLLKEEIASDCAQSRHFSVLSLPKTSALLVFECPRFLCCLDTVSHPKFDNGV